MWREELGASGGGGGEEGREQVLNKNQVIKGSLTEKRMTEQRFEGGREWFMCIYIYPIYFVYHLSIYLSINLSIYLSSIYLSSVYHLCIHLIYMYAYHHHLRQKDKQVQNPRGRVKG